MYLFHRVNSGKYQVETGANERIYDSVSERGSGPNLTPIEVQFAEFLGDGSETEYSW